MRSELVDRDYSGLLQKALDALFSDVLERKRVQKVLDEYQSQEPERVRLGILKASNGELQQIKDLTRLAQEDFRDLLCVAEYPLTSRHLELRDKDPKRYNALLEQEQAAYESWLKAIGIA